MAVSTWKVARELIRNAWPGFRVVNLLELA